MSYQFRTAEFRKNSYSQTQTCHFEVFQRNKNAFHVQRKSEMFAVESWPLFYHGFVLIDIVATAIISIWLDCIISNSLWTIASVCVQWEDWSVFEVRSKIHVLSAFRSQNLSRSLTPTVKHKRCCLWKREEAKAFGSAHWPYLNYFTGFVFWVSWEKHRNKIWTS